jgi:hypothetical protein
LTIGICSEIPTGRRIIVAIEVVIKAGFCVVILSWEAEVIGDPLNANLSIAEGVIFRSRDNPTAARDQLLRCAKKPEDRGQRTDVR